MKKLLYTHCYTDEALKLCESLCYFWNDCRAMRVADFGGLGARRAADNEVLFELTVTSGSVVSNERFVKVMREVIARQHAFKKPLQRAEVSRAIMTPDFIVKADELLKVMSGELTRSESKLAGIKLDPFMSETITALELELKRCEAAKKQALRNIWNWGKVRMLDTTIGWIEGAIESIRAGFMPSPETLCRCRLK